VDGVKVDTYYAVTTDGVFGIRVYMAETQIDAGGVVVNPNNIKIDFLVHNYPYVQMQSRLCLHTHISGQSQSQATGQTSVDERTIQFGDKALGPLGAFSWDIVVNATNDVEKVVAWSSTKSPGTQYDFYFTFLTETGSLHPLDIVWDPRLGLDYAAHVFCIGSLCEVAAIVVIAAIVIVGVAGLALCAFTYIRRRNRGYAPLN